MVHAISAAKFGRAMIPLKHRHTYHSSPKINTLSTPYSSRRSTLVANLFGLERAKGGAWEKVEHKSTEGSKFLSKLANNGSFRQDLYFV